MMNRDYGCDTGCDSQPSMINTQHNSRPCLRVRLRLTFGPKLVGRIYVLLLMCYLGLLSQAQLFGPYT
ncbi:hypothetical protein HanPSC8_Chr12g0542991 [Helianthus annuus]|nr:hypothetical protein HanPSC8_Chr12g0542991 [Helianthus annuus]